MKQLNETQRILSFCILDECLLVLNEYHGGDGTKDESIFIGWSVKV